MSTPFSNQTPAFPGKPSNDPASLEREDSAALFEVEYDPSDESFGEILSDFEGQQDESRLVNGTVVSVRADDVLIDIGRKVEGSLPLERWREIADAEPSLGATVQVIVGRYNEEGYYDLTTVKVERPRDWSGLEAAFEAKTAIAGTVLELVKGGFRVDVGVPAFMPASRSGVREMSEMPSLVGQQIRCRITKLNTAEEDVVVDRRALLEEEEAERKQSAFAGLREGMVMRGRVRNVMDFGAFIDLGGVDGLLHVAEISHSRVAKASDVLKVGDEIEVKVIKVDAAARKISLSAKQLQEDPWAVAARTLTTGDRISGTVSRLTDFGAFIELMPGVDGLIHVSELSWNKKVRKPADLLKAGERVEAVVLGVNASERRISLGYKQALGDPWEKIPERYPIGTVVEGAVSNLTAFGAFVDVGDGLEGMIHISDITHEKRIDHPKEKLLKGQAVKAVVLEVDSVRRRLRLGLKQLEPTTVDHYISEHHQGDTVSGRLLEVNGGRAKVELGEGVIGMCQLRSNDEEQETLQPSRKASSPADVGSLSAMLAAKWKSGNEAGPDRATTQRKSMARAGEVRSFRIRTMDAAKKLIELELAS